MPGIKAQPHKPAPFPSGNWNRYVSEGITVTKRKLRAYSVYTLSDTVGTSFKFRYDQILSASSNFWAPDLNPLGELTTLSSQEIHKHHAGNFKYRIKMTNPINDDLLVQNVLIPAAKFSIEMVVLPAFMFWA